MRRKIILVFMIVVLLVYSSIINYEPMPSRGAAALMNPEDFHRRDVWVWRINRWDTKCIGRSLKLITRTKTMESLPSSFEAIRLTRQDCEAEELLGADSLPNYLSIREWKGRIHHEFSDLRKSQFVGGGVRTWDDPELKGSASHPLEWQNGELHFVTMYFRVGGRFRVVNVLAQTETNYALIFLATSIVVFIAYVFYRGVKKASNKRLEQRP